MLSRRSFLQTSLALPLLPAFAKADTPFSGMIVRSTEPTNLEFPIHELKSHITPNGQFFVRSHFAVPSVPMADWKLSVEGAVETPLSLSYDDLLKLPTRKQNATIECAGNGRVFLTPPVPGLQWSQGAVGNAEWEGVPLAAILDKAGVKANAVEVVFEGADKGQVKSDPKSPGPISFARSISLAKAKSSDVLLAHRMNGEKLDASHGFPLRAVVAGYYGMSSVKWLSKIVVSDKPFQGFWQSLDYSIWQRPAGIPTLVPLMEMQPKAVVARPGLKEIVPAGKPLELFGAAWAGENAVAKVEWSADGGKTWQDAKFQSESKPLEWVFWKAMWDKPAVGKAAIVVKATDAKGRTQPEKRDPDRRTYAINHWVPIEVTVQ
jgi:DMSO/TMAO reductase YedYZ molybdopterin-dependent catalytic subunit